MFGYVRPRKDQLKVCDYERYQAAYCGLCRALGRQYGFLYRFFVNYDMTFLYLLLAGLQPEDARKKCHCPANIFCRKTCYLSDDGYREVAAMDVILCHYQLCDAVSDRGLLKSIPYRLVRALTKRGYRKAAKHLPSFDRLAEAQLNRLSELERAHCASIDQAADSFASILKGCAEGLTLPQLQRPAQQLLYHVGRFLYLADALDDLAGDCANERYNPLRFRFTVNDGKLQAQELLELGQTMEQSVSLAGAALELLPLQSHKDILNNIIYLGLPTVRKAVSEGKFQARAKI